jgi:hypothetical protein
MSKTQAFVFLCLAARYLWLEWTAAKRSGGIDAALFGAACWCAMFVCAVGVALGLLALIYPKA